MSIDVCPQEYFFVVVAVILTEQYHLPFPRSLVELGSGSWSHEQCWEWVPSHEVNLQSRQILVGYSHQLCAIIALARLACRSPFIAKRFCCWVDTYLQPSVVGRVPSSTLNTTSRVKALGRYHYFSMSNVLCGYHLQQQGLIISLWGTADSLGNSLSYLGVLIGPLWQRIQLDATHFWNWILLLMKRDILLGLHLSHHLAIPFRSPPCISIKLRKLLLWQVSLQLSISPRFYLSLSMHSLPYPLFPPLPI